MLRMTCSLWLAWYFCSCSGLSPSNIMFLTWKTWNKYHITCKNQACYLYLIIIFGTFCVFRPTIQVIYTHIIPMSSCIVKWVSCWMRNKQGLFQENKNTAQRCCAWEGHAINLPAYCRGMDLLMIDARPSKQMTGMYQTRVCKTCLRYQMCVED